MELGSLKRVLNCTQVFVSQLSKISRPCCEYGLAENLVIRNLHKFQNLRINYDFFGLDVVNRFPGM